MYLYNFIVTAESAFEGLAGVFSVTVSSVIERRWNAATPPTSPVELGLLMSCSTRGLLVTIPLPV